MRVDRDYEGTGMAGFGTNKGGVAIGVRVWDTELCFVNSHLAAHQDQVCGGVCGEDGLCFD